MSSIQINDTNKFKELVDKFNSTLNQINQITGEINSNFDKIGYGDMWEGIAKERAMEKERTLRSCTQDAQTILIHKYMVMSSALNSYIALDQLLNAKINERN